jgi:glycosyltransferase involved in cell wall biosynthesis
MVTPWYGARDGGGVGIAIENLVHSLLRRGVKVWVIKVVGDGLFPRFNRGHQNELIVQLPLRGRSEFVGGKASLGYWLRSLIATVVLLGLRITTRFQLINFHYYTPPYEVLRKILRFARYSFISGFQGSDIMIAPQDAEIRQTLGYFVRDAEKLVGVSTVLINELKRLFPETGSKCSLIPNTVDADFITSASAYLPDGDVDFDVLFVGGLIPVKGPDMLIEAFHKVVQRRPETVLCIAGTGYMEKELRETIKSRNFEPNVKFAGFVPHLDLVDYYNRTRLVVIPSRSEGFPLAAMEAAICGKPVVAFSVGGLSELVVDGSTGTLVTPTDVDGLATAMLALLESPSRAVNVGEQAKKRGLQAFDPAAMAQSYLNLYQTVINRNSQT